MNDDFCLVEKLEEVVKGYFEHAGNNLVSRSRLHKAISSLSNAFAVSDIKLDCLGLENNEEGLSIRLRNRVEDVLESGGLSLTDDCFRKLWLYVEKTIKFQRFSITSLEDSVEDRKIIVLNRNLRGPTKCHEWGVYKKNVVFCKTTKKSNEIEIKYYKLIFFKEKEVEND